MALPRTTLGRIILAVLLLWFVVGLVALVLFSSGGVVPGVGQGERIELPR
jgi:hypothetical protein